uniref:Methyltransferase type 11 domain-containing protein n=1 Tax=Chlamydomonas leiostraca TaxID=1034604 RepID=A0A7S0WLT3_9CHLO
MGADVLTGARTVLSREERARLDESDDGAFYEAPRAGVHNTDAHFRRALAALYARLLTPRSSVLELCASWDSCLPHDLPLASVVGYGMNQAELDANHRLTARVVHDLNQRPQLEAVASASVDAVVCANGLQYLTHPEWVAAEALRAVKPGGLAVITFSPHCWAAKATSGWLARDAGQRLALVGRILDAAGFVDIQYAWVPGTSDTSAGSGPPPISLSSTVPEQLLSSAAPAAGKPAPPAAGPFSSGSADYVSYVLRSSGPLPTGSGDAGARSTPGLAAQDAGGDDLYAVVARRRPQQDSYDTPAVPTPSEVAASFTAPALREIEVLQPPAGAASAVAVSEATLERWRIAYGAMVHDAQALGIPASVIPALPPGASAADIRGARDTLQGMLASYLSAGL